MSVGTRQRQIKANATSSRRSVNSLRSDIGGLVYEAATIASVASTNSFDDSASGLPVFSAGSLVEVRGSTLNSRQYTVSSSDADSLVVVEDLVQDESEGDSILIRSA